MKTAAKVGLGILITAIVLIVFFIAVSRLLAPSFIKSELSQQVYQLTGRSLEINGDVNWSFFPWLGIKAHNVVLNNSPEFGSTPLVKANSVQLDVRLMPLFSHRLEVGNVFIDGFDLSLVKNVKGQINWANLLPVSSQKSVAGENENSAKFNMFKVNLIRLKDGKVSFNDQQKQKRIELNQLNFNTKNIAWNKAFPVDLSFNFNQQPSSLSGHIKFNGKLIMDPAKNVLNFPQLSFDGSFKRMQGNASIIHAAGDLIYRSNDGQFFIHQIKVKLNDHAFSGDLAGTLAPTFSAHGHLGSPSLVIGNFLFENVQTVVGIKNAIISLNSLTANLSGGHYAGDILIDTKPAAPVVTFNGMLKQADVGMLFANVINKQNKPFTGMLDMSTMLTFTLGEADSIRKTLNGNITVRLQNGILHGVNFPALIELGQSLLKHGTPPVITNNQTDFGVIKGTFQIQNGMMVNQDLILQSSQLNATGQGKIDLVNNQIDYRLTANLVGHKTLVPISIRGSLDNPVIAPDTQQLARQMLDEQTNRLLSLVAKPGETDKLKEKVGKELQKLNLGSLLG